MKVTCSLAQALVLITCLFFASSVAEASKDFEILLTQSGQTKPALTAQHGVPKATSTAAARGSRKDPGMALLWSLVCCVTAYAVFRLAARKSGVPVRDMTNALAVGAASGVPILVLQSVVETSVRSSKWASAWTLSITLPAALEQGLLLALTWFALRPRQQSRDTGHWAVCAAMVGLGLACVQNVVSLLLSVYWSDLLRYEGFRHIPLWAGLGRALIWSMNLTGIFALIITTIAAPVWASIWGAALDSRGADGKIAFGRLMGALILACFLEAIFFLGMAVPVAPVSIMLLGQVAGVAYLVVRFTRRKLLSVSSQSLGSSNDPSGTNSATGSSVEGQMQSPDPNGIVVACAGCGAQNRIKPHGPSVSPLCGRCGRSLAGVSPWFTATAGPETKTRGDLYGKLAVGLVVLVLGFIVVIKSIDKPAGNVTPSKRAVAPSAPKTPPQPLPNRRLVNGTMIRSGILNGKGHLEVQNGLERDAVVKLVPVGTKNSTAFFYVASKSAHKIEGIPDGQYNLLFCSGTDWDDSKRSFTREKSFSRFQEPSSWDTTTETMGNQIRTLYTIRRVTLHPVQGGKARTSLMGEGDFGRYE